ncbi:uncharacterized protein [Spinacia oleracea]|uniref:Uncharacterized protein n=1 Tax=Spinacia oleracea TaxID=3562 RepID=A0A9R0IC79_SPIOL|nr:uncharacterized protein LOC110786376 [Spinacia oleracea]
MDSPIADTFSSLRLPSLSPADYESTVRALGYVETRLRTEKEEISHKYNNAVKEINILSKQLSQYRTDHGDFLISVTGYEQQLSELNSECAHLRVKLAAADKEAQRSKDNQVEAKLSMEVKMLKKQNMHLSEENAILEAAKAKFEGELSACKLKVLQSEVLKGKIKMLEEEKKEMEKVVNEAQKDIAENSKIRMENNRLKGELQDVRNAAAARFCAYDRRLSALEENVTELMEDYIGSLSGSQVVDEAEVVQEQESLKLEAKTEELVGTQSGYETIPIKEKTTSSEPSPVATSATTRVQAEHENYESLIRPRSAARPIAEAHFVDLCDSDDDYDEPPLSKGIKRKLPSSDVLLTPSNC